MNNPLLSQLLPWLAFTAVALFLIIRAAVSYVHKLIGDHHMRQIRDKLVEAKRKRDEKSDD